LNPPSPTGSPQELPSGPRHIPIKYNGLSLPHPFWEQGITAIRIFLELTNTNRPENTLIQTSLEYLQLEVGTSTPILQADFSCWGHLAMPCWIKSLWAFLHEATISLWSSNHYVPTPQWEGDSFLMDSLHLLSLLSSELAAFNCCHLAHCVLFLSDICDGWGHSLHDLILWAPPSPLKSRWSWPRSATASADWTIWESCLRRLLPLLHLGPWTTPPHLASFCPFDPNTLTAFLPSLSPPWHSYHPQFPHPPQGQQTLFWQGITLSLSQLSFYMQGFCIILGKP